MTKIVSSFSFVAHIRAVGRSENPGKPVVEGEQKKYTNALKSEGNTLGKSASKP